jgi:hypothetical protein
VPLLESHILPSFAFKALKKGAVTGHIRRTDNPNLRVQDGAKANLLCADCETRFSAWEREFANKIFHPWQEGATQARYGEWMLKFCVSVSWRVLRYCLGYNPSSEYTLEQQTLATEAEVVWREFLLGQRRHPAHFPQQFLVFDLIESTTVEDMPENINRFMMNAITMDIVGSHRTLMTWAKLGQFQIYGVIQPGPNKFEGTKVHVRDGAIRPGKFVIPAGLLDLFREKAQHAQNAMNDMSEVQADKIDVAVMQNLDRLANSKQFAAMQADAEMFGVQAVVRRSKTTP